MSERKVLNKYIPPDFDPSALERRVKKPKKSGPQTQTIRLMAPYSMRCNACGEYIYKGRKFNGKKEDTADTYYGVRIFRFHIKCTRCSATITFKTDPKNADYTAEAGATRNFEPWRKDEDEVTDEEGEAEKEAADKDAMQQLEARTMEAKREMEIEDVLDAIRTRNARLNKVDTGDLLRSIAVKGADGQSGAADNDADDARDRELARQVFASEDGDVVVRRLTGPPDETGFSGDQGAKAGKLATSGSFAPISTAGKKRERGLLLGVKLTKRTKV